MGVPSLEKFSAWKLDGLIDSFSFPPRFMYPLGLRSRLPQVVVDELCFNN